MTAFNKIISNGLNIVGDMSRVTSEAGGFSRLKSIFLSGQNYNSYERIVSSAQNKILGNVPNEIIRKIIKIHPENKAEKIKEAQSSFGLTADLLRDIESCEINAIKNLSTQEDEIHFLLKELCHLKTNSLSQQSLEKIYEAEKKLSQNLKDILQIDLHCNLEFLGYGQFGNAYKMSIADNLDKPIMHDRVLKVFKDTNLNIELAVLKRKKVKELISKYSDEEIYEIYKNIPVNTNNKVKISIKCPEEQKKRIFLNNLRTKRLEIQNSDLSNIEESFYEQIRDLSREHGIYAEANTAFRLKNILGHNISKTDVVSVDMFDLEHKYSITQFSDDLLSPVQSKINFEKLGLRYGDSKQENYVLGRIIDYGGIMHIDSRLFDKTILKYYKKIMNRTNMTEQKELMQRYAQMIENPKCPDRDKIRSALGLANDLYRFKYGIPSIGQIDCYF